MPLAFPQPARYQLRDDDNDDFYGLSPAATTPSTFAIDPAILNEDHAGKSGQSAFSPPEDQHGLQLDPSLTPYAHNTERATPIDAYSRDFPQGPPPEPIFLPDEPVPYDDPPPRPLKKPRRLKRPKRELECSFCQGTDDKNKDGFPEYMLSCTNCGRSGHPTCLDISQISNTVFNYPWTCIECKACEICQDKGDDTKLLFCDNCDRGWHYDCLVPPLDGAPDGNWNCPMCPPLPPDIPVASTSQSREFGSPIPEVEMDQAPSEEEEEEEEEGEEEEEEGIEVIPSVVKTKGKHKAKSRSGHLTIRRPPAKKVRAHPAPTTLAPSRPEGKVTFRLRLGGPKGKERAHQDDDEANRSPFEGVLSTDELDTTKTSILTEDKVKFERSRVAAENKLAPRLPPPQPPDTPGGPSGSSSHVPFRPLRSVAHLFPSTPHPSEPPSTPAATMSTPLPGTPTSDGSIPLRIRVLRFGQFDIDTWYDAPFPEEYNNIPEGRLWMCEFCLKYMKSGFGAERHRLKCKARHPPGDEIYRDGSISVFEVDGRKNKIYCQNLCLLSKMFLDHKSLFYDVEPFLFYVMTEVENGGARFVGYFSKEKRSPKDYNVSCIMTLPVRQRRGWGNLLIDFSYLLSKKEGRVGSPEKPLSALGALSYRNYWTLSLMQYLQTASGRVTLEDISAKTSMMIPDILSVLREQNMIIVDERPLNPMSRSPALGKGRPRVRNHTSFSRRSLNRKNTASKEESTAEPAVPASYEIRWDKDIVDTYLAKWSAKGYLTLKPHRLKWSPYLLARTQKADTVATPTISTADVSTTMVDSRASTDTVSLLDSGGLGSSPGSPRKSKSPRTVEKMTPRADIHEDILEESMDTPSRPPKRRTNSTRRTQRSRSALRNAVATAPDYSSEDDHPIASLNDDEGDNASVSNGVSASLPTLRTRSRVTIPARKRRRIESSPESSTLSDPPSSPAHSLSPPPLTRSLRSKGNIGRVTRSAASAPVVNGVNGFSPSNGRRSTRLNSLARTTQFTHFRPLFDDPEEALRSARKGRSNSIGSMGAPVDSVQKPLQVPDPPAMEVDVDILPDAILTKSSDTNVADVHLNGTSMNGMNSYGTDGFMMEEDDLDDVDAEGEDEEIIDGGEASLPAEPTGVDYALYDEDAEGDDIDAEGEPE